MKLPARLFQIPPGWVDRFPDGDYTIGRGADPRSAAERAADPDGSIARRKLEFERAGHTTERVEPSSSVSSEAAE